MKALLALILASFEDAFWQSKFDEKLWDRVTKIISSNIDAFNEVLEPWAMCVDGDGYALSKRLERILIPYSSSED